MASKLPPTTLVRANDTHPLIPTRFENSVLAKIANSDEHLAAIFELDNATNDRLLAENGFLPGIGIHELLFGVPYYRIVNAAFTHAHPLGSRFNGPDRGAWYASFAIETAHAEVAYHKTLELAEIGVYDDEVTYRDYLADFSADLHDLRLGDPAFTPCLHPDKYTDSQDLARDLLSVGAIGVVYPSVRHKGGTCIACFRPAVVSNVRESKVYRFSWTGTTTPAIEEVT